MRQGVFQVLIVVLIATSLFAGTASGDVEVSPMTVVEDKTYTITVDREGRTYDSVGVSGPVTVINDQQTSDVVEIEIRGDSVDREQNGALEVSFDNGETERIRVEVIPDWRNAGSGDSNYREDAIKWREFEDKWVNQRVEETQTEEGLMIVYEQRDPTKGGIDPETGQPRGEWVQVPVDEDGNPQWLYNNPDEAMVYMSQKAHQDRSEYRMWMGFGIASPILILVGVFAIVPRWRKRKEDERWTPRGDQP